MSEITLIFGSIATILIIAALQNSIFDMADREDSSLSWVTGGLWIAGTMNAYIALAAIHDDLAALIAIIAIPILILNFLYRIIQMQDFSIEYSGVPNAVVVILSGIVGSLVATYVGSELLGFATVAIVAGAVVTVGLVWVFGSPPRFAGAGASFTLSSAIVFHLSGSALPDEFTQTAFVSLLGLGLLSGLIVLTQETIAYLIRRALRNVTNEEHASIIWRAISSFAGLLVIVWAVFTAEEKIIRVGGVSIGGSVMFALNILGIELPIPIWFLSGGLDATVFLYIGCVVIGFHSLDTFYTGWHATKTTAKAGVKAGSVAATEGKNVAQSAAAQASDVSESASVSATDVGEAVKDRYDSE